MLPVGQTSRRYISIFPGDIRALTFLDLHPAKRWFAGHFLMPDYIHLAGFELAVVPASN